jgi:hypothetical protein
MKKIIRRHNFNETLINDKFDYFTGKLHLLSEILKRKPENAGTLFTQSRNAIGDGIVAKQSKKDILNLLSVSTDLGINHFRNAMNSHEVELKMGNEIFSVTTVRDNLSYTDPVYWTKYFYTALLSRDRKAIDELISIPEDFMRKAQIAYDEVDFAIVRFLKGLYQPTAKLGNLLQEALILSDPDEHDADRFDYLMYLKVPELNLYLLAFSNDNEGFNEALFEALENHKKFWSKKDNKNYAEGWISFPILCACLIAVNSKKYTIDVESDYLPMWLITGDMTED